MTIALAPKETSCVVIHEWKGVKYRLTLHNVDPSMQEAVKAAAAPFFEALDSHGDLSKMGKKEQVPFRITSREMAVKNNPVHSETARKITQIFSSKDLSTQKRELTALGDRFNQYLNLTRSLKLQELPNVGNTCFFNSAISAIAHPALLSQLVKFPQAFIASKARAAAIQAPENWPGCKDQREQTEGARAYRQYLHTRAKENPDLFAGGANHPFYKLISNYHRGDPISANEMRNLIDRLVLDQKCGEEGVPFGLGRFSAYEQLDPGEALTALRAQIDCTALKKLSPELVSSTSLAFSTEEFKNNPIEQTWIPINCIDDQCLPEIEIDPAHGLIKGLWNKLYDTDPVLTPLRRDHQIYIPRAHRGIFQTVPLQLIIGLNQTVPVFQEMKEADLVQFITALRAALEKSPHQNRPINLEELDHRLGKTLEKISNDPALFQKLSHLLEEDMRSTGQRKPYIPVKKRHAPLRSVPLSFKTPRWFSESGKEEVLELTGFSFHNGGAKGGHYWAYARRGDRFFKVDDRAGTATFPREITQKEFLKLATEARKLVYTKKYL